MFTGIIEAVGEVKEVLENGSNKSFWISSTLSSELKVDQSVAHDGACLTVEEVNGTMHKVTAVEETLKKTNLNFWKPGTLINLERSLLLNTRLDGHFVQGHVDTTAVCKKIKNKEGSFEYRFRFPRKFASLVIEKGSVAINGISLTVFDVKKNLFTVAIIPYTYAYTNIRTVEVGDEVNIEFDMIGKYINRMAETR